MFELVIHADWSRHDRGRWFAAARRDGLNWRVRAPAPVGDLDRFRDVLLDDAHREPVLAGFDFPIGVPVAYGALTGLADFRTLLPVIGTGAWRDFDRPAATVEEISVRRPFYPAGTGAGTKRASLVERLGLASADELLRDCERGGPSRRRASPLFWTVGAAQVGRAALTGWRHVVGPALQSGAALWPFDGPLERCADRPCLVIAETYPADAYAAVGAPFRAREGKRRQADRRDKADPILRWAAARDIDLAACDAVLRDGFGPARSGEDAFDALLGLIAMLAIVDGSAPAMTAELSPEQLAWEGWILGR